MKQTKLLRLFVLALLFAMDLPTIAQNIGETSYRRSYGGGGGLEKICRNSLGKIYGGDIFKEFPVGTILEAKYMGNGYYTARSFDNPEEGILYGTESVSPEEVNPKNAVGKTFSVYNYATPYPSLGDEPVSIQHLTLETIQDPTEESGDAILRMVTINNPDTRSESESEVIYLGNFLPYCVSFTKKLENGKFSAIDEIRLYSQTVSNRPANVYAVLFDGKMFDNQSN